MNIYKLSFLHFIIWVRFPFFHLTVNFLVFFFHFSFFNIDFDGYYIVRIAEGQPSPKLIFEWNQQLFFYSLRFGASSTQNFYSILWTKKGRIKGLTRQKVLYSDWFWKPFTASTSWHDLRIYMIKQKFIYMLCIAVQTARLIRLIFCGHSWVAGWGEGCYRLK